MNVLDIDSVLAEAGLSKSVRAVYLAGLATIEMSSAQLVAATRLPRPTVMSALKELQRVGLCTSEKLDGRSFRYAMQPMNGLKPMLGKRMRTLDALIECLDMMSQLTSPKTLIRQAQGQEEVKDLLEIALRCNSRKWSIIAPYDNVLRFMPKEYIAYFKRVRKERQIQSQTLWGTDWSEQSVNMNDLLMRKPRYVPKNISQDIPSMLICFDDMVLGIEGQENPQAILLQSEAIAGTYQLVFELAWRACR